ncbi:hypothetical protein BKA80DRAFT_29882 [Phyllosticta citrichinensis]
MGRGWGAVGGPRPEQFRKPRGMLMQVELLSTEYFWTKNSAGGSTCQDIFGHQKGQVSWRDSLLSAPWAFDLSRLLISVIRIRRRAAIGAECMLLARDAVFGVESHCRASRRMRLSAADDVCTSDRRGQISNAGLARRTHASGDPRQSHARKHHCGE